MTTLIPKFRQPYSGASNLPINQKLQQTINVLDFGATGDGTTDDTTAIQNAINAAGSNGTIIFPKGTFLLSATLNGLTNQSFIGSGVNNTILYRTGNYGDTLYFTNAGAAYINGIWFKHDTLPATGFTTLTNKVTTGSHINFANCQGAIIENCWLWRMQFGIKIQQGAIVKINKCNLQGVWNTFYVAGQEGIASIFIGSNAYAQLVSITDCYFGGSNSGAQTVTITTSDRGANTVNFTGTNAGAEYGILVYSCEGLTIDNCYIGGNAINNILLSPNNTMSQVRIVNNFFDGAGYASPCIYILPQSNGQYPTQVTINSNNFNCELYAYQAIGSLNSFGSDFTMTAFQITGNIISNVLGSGIFLRQVSGGVIQGNTITAYNGRNLSSGTDVNYCVGIYVTTSSGTYIVDNLVGGGTNNASPTGGYCYQGIIIAGTNTEVDAKNNYFNGVGTPTLLVGRVDKATVISSSGTNYTMTGAEDLVIINNSGSSAIQVTPPSNLPQGYTFVLKDGAGTAAAHNIQFMATVDGTANPSYSTNYFSKTFTWNGTQWNITGN